MLQHPFLSGNHDLTIDEKNRLLVPADIRKRLSPERDGEAFYIVPGMNQRPWFYPEKYYEALAQSPPQLAPQDDLLTFDQMAALAQRLEWDKQGRIVLPARMLERYGIGREVTLIGARNRLELWNRTEWADRSEEIWTRSSEIAQRASQTSQPFPRVD